jgi:hypothetical protein
VRIDHAGGNDAGAERVGDVQAEEQEGDEIAASCRPLRKSKTSATAISPNRTGNDKAMSMD